MDSHGHTYRYIPYSHVSFSILMLRYVAVNLMGLHFGEDSEIQISDSIEYDRLLPTHLRLRRKERDYDIDDEDDTPTAEALDISPFGGLEYPDNIDPTQFEPSPRATPSNNAQDTLSHSYIEVCLSPRNTRVWTQEDRENLVKIGRMISSFLEVPAFAADTKVFHNHVITPLMCSSGPYPGAVEMLTQVMESVMIRHRYICSPDLRSVTDVYIGSKM